MGFSAVLTPSDSMKLALLLCGVIVLIVMAEACDDAFPEYCSEASGDACYDEGFREDCCGMCTALKGDVEGCEYGDHVPWCDEYTSEDCGVTPGIKELCCQSLCKED